MFVLTADQVHSRRVGDRVPEALAALDAAVGPTQGLVLAFERTVGDELQGVLDRSSGVVRAVETLTRQGQWRIGVGVSSDRASGLPGSAREATGPAFLAARHAIERARSSPADCAVAWAGGEPTGEQHLLAGGGDLLVQQAEGVLWLLVSTWRRRTPEGWEVVDLVRGGSRAEAAGALGVSASAVTQRLRAAAYREAERASRSLEWLLDQTGAGA